MDLIFATGNQNKLIEINKIIPKNINIISFKDLKFDEEVPENENTIEKNAIYKAKYIYNKFNINVFSDDTGLEVETLNGEPGVYSARYAGMHCSAEDNIKLAESSWSDKDPISVENLRGLASYRES